MEEIEKQPKSISRRVADVLVVVFHPCFLFFYIAFFFGLLIPSEVLSFWKVIPVFFVGTVLVPAFLPYLLHKDMFLHDRTKRFLPLLLTALCYLVSLRIFSYIIKSDIDAIPTSNISQKILAGIPAGRVELFFPYVNTCIRLLYSQIVGLGLAAFVSHKFKVSLHGMGLGFLWAFAINPLFVDTSGEYSANLFMFPYWDISFELSPLYMGILLLLSLITYTVLWQRYTTGSHTRWELVTGLSLGFLGTMVFLQMDIFHLRHFAGFGEILKP